MRLSLLAPAVALTLATSSMGQPAPPFPDGEADAEQPGFSCDAGTLNDLIFQRGDFFGTVHLASPSRGTAGVPRNPLLVLGGFLGDLDLEPAFLEVALIAPDGSEVPFERTGHFVRPLAQLEPFTEYNLAVRQADVADCPDCFFGESTPFTTGDHLDRERPTLDAGAVVQAFVVSQQDEFCGFGKMFLVGRLDDLAYDVSRVSVALVTEGGVAQRVADLHVTDRLSALYFSSQVEDGVALGDDVRVAVTAFDYAGNESPAQTVRVRARPLSDARDVEFDDLDSRQCALPNSSVLALPQVIPTNARLRLEHPLEPVPLALSADDVVVPLLPVEHLGDVQTVQAIEPLPADTELEVTALPCPHCACPGCAVAAYGSVRTGAGPDETPPAPPVVVELREDLDPPRAEDACYPD